jgi:putative AdoMet-dependent methyltransferase
MSTPAKATWWSDDRRQIGTDFANADQVADYDRRQGNRDRHNDELLQRLGVEEGQIVVDIGTGTGSLARAAARRSARVHAVDISDTMLHFARARAEAEGLEDRISFHRAGFLSYRHGDAPADWVFSQMALHHLSDFWKQEALLRIHALLKPNGRFFLRDVVFSFEPNAMAAGIETWIGRVAREDGTGWTRADFSTHVREEHSTYAWILEGMLRRAGFVIEQATYDTPAYATYLCIAHSA